MDLYAITIRGECFIIIMNKISLISLLLEFLARESEENVRIKYDVYMNSLCEEPSVGKFENNITL